MMASVGFCVAKQQESFEYLVDAIDILLDRFVVQQHLTLVLAGGIAHLAGASANENYRLITGSLQMPKDHYLQNGTHVGEIGRGVKLEVGAYGLVF